MSTVPSNEMKILLSASVYNKDSIDIKAEKKKIKENPWVAKITSNFNKLPEAFKTAHNSATNELEKLALDVAYALALRENEKKLISQDLRGGDSTTFGKIGDYYKKQNQVSRVTSEKMKEALDTVVDAAAEGKPYDNDLKKLIPQGMYERMVARIENSQWAAVDTRDPIGRAVLENRRKSAIETAIQNVVDNTVTEIKTTTQAATAEKEQAEKKQAEAKAEKDRLEAERAKAKAEAKAARQAAEERLQRSKKLDERINNFETKRTEILNQGKTLHEEIETEIQKTDTELDQSLKEMTPENIMNALRNFVGIDIEEPYTPDQKELSDKSQRLNDIQSGVANSGAPLAATSFAGSINFQDLNNADAAEKKEILKKIVSNSNANQSPSLINRDSPIQIKDNKLKLETPALSRSISSVESPTIIDLPVLQTNINLGTDEYKQNLYELRKQNPTKESPQEEIVTNQAMIAGFANMALGQLDRDENADVQKAINNIQTYTEKNLTLAEAMLETAEQALSSSTTQFTVASKSNELNTEPALDRKNPLSPITDKITGYRYALRHGVGHARRDTAVTLALGVAVTAAINPWGIRDKIVSMVTPPTTPTTEQKETPAWDGSTIYGDNKNFSYITKSNDQIAIKLPKRETLFANPADCIVSKNQIQCGEALLKRDSFANKDNFDKLKNFLTQNGATKQSALPSQPQPFAYVAFPETPPAAPEKELKTVILKNGKVHALSSEEQTMILMNQLNTRGV
jgi:hypothetical protein